LHLAFVCLHACPIHQNVPLDSSCYNAALAGCLDDVDRFEQLRAEMRQAGVPANTATLVIATHVCESNNLFEQAFLLQRDVLSCALLLLLLLLLLSLLLLL
jgi:hypothetical protein